MKKRVFYSELAYVIGIITLAIGTAFMERADFGVSMVIAPPYILHLKISEFLPFFSFGMASYSFQTVLLVVMMIILRRVRLKYFLSLLTAAIYGLCLDLFILAIANIAVDNLVLRIGFYILGMLLCAAAISLLYHTYIPPEAYELFVKEISRKFSFDIIKAKTLYDCSSCLLAVLMSFIFFGLWHFEGVKIGTVLCAILNGTLIGMFSKIFETFWTFRNAFSFGSPSISNEKND